MVLRHSDIPADDWHPGRQSHMCLLAYRQNLLNVRLEAVANHSLVRVWVLVDVMRVNAPRTGQGFGGPQLVPVLVRGPMCDLSSFSVHVEEDADMICGGARTASAKHAGQSARLVRIASSVQGRRSCDDTKG